MATNPLGSGVSRYIDGRDRQFAAVVFQKRVPPLDSEWNLVSLMELEARAETIRARYPSGWVMDESNPLAAFRTDPSYSNLFYFGKQESNEVRNVSWAIVNGWMVPVMGTRIGDPPLAPNDVDTWNRIELNPPSTSTGGNRAEFVFLEVWLARIDVDPAPPAVAAGKPQRESLWRFGNVEGGYSFLPDDLVDPDLNYETTKRVQVQYRIRVVTDVNLMDYPDGFDPSLVFAQGMLSTPSTTPFENMREALGDPGLWRAGTGDPATFGTVDGYVYAVPICAAFRRNSAGFSDVGNLAGAFNRNSVTTNRDGATEYSTGVFLPTDISETDVQFTLSSITGTVLETMTDFGEAYFRVDDEIILVSSVVQTGPTAFAVNFSRGALATTIREHDAGKELTPYTVRPDGLFADQVARTDLLDLRHSVRDGFDFEAMLKTNFVELMKGNLKTAWKRYGSTNSAGTVVLYGDRVTDSTTFVGGLTRLDGPNGNRRLYSDCVVTERYEVAVEIPSNGGSIGDQLALSVPPFQIDVIWNGSDPTRLPGSRLVGGVKWWFYGDQLKINLADFLVGLPVSDSDQVRFVLPSEDDDAVVVRFEGMTTDPTGGEPEVGPNFTRAPTVTHPAESGPNAVTVTGNRIMKDGQGIAASLDGSGNLLITFDGGTSGDQMAEFNDAMSGFGAPTDLLVEGTVMHIQFSVVYGAGRGLSHRPKYVHTVHFRDTTGVTRTMTRPGLADAFRMIPTYVGDSPYVQMGTNRTLARTSEVMVDPGSKTLCIAPYKLTEVPNILCRDGRELNWYGNPITYQGGSPMLTQDGSSTAWLSTQVDSLNLFYGTGTADCRYVEIQMEYLPRPGFHHVPIVPTTTSNFPSGINFLLLSSEGPITGDTAEWNRNLVSYPDTAGYYVVTPVSGEVYGTQGATKSVFGQKFTSNAAQSYFGGPFKGIQFPPFYAPARITGVYLRDSATNPLTPANTPFNTDRQYVGGAGTDVNLLRDDFDGATFLLHVDVNGDLTFVLSADVLDLSKAPSGTTFDNSEFLVECTLFSFDRGFLQTNGRVFCANNLGGGANIEISANEFTTSTDGIGIVAPLPLSVDSTNNELTAYYSRVPYQGDVFGSQSAYSDDLYRRGPLSVSEATAIHNSPLGPVDTLALNNKAGYEIVASMSFVTTLGTGRLSGANPLPLLSTVSNPTSPPDYAGNYPDLFRRFSYNRVGGEDWVTPKFPVTDASFSSRPDIVRGALSEVFDRDLHPEFAGAITNLPLGIYFRDKDFYGKSMYQTRSANNVAAISLGTMAFPPFQTALTPPAPGIPQWEGIEFVCGNASNTTGVGGESMVKVDGTNVTTDVTNFKTTRGGAAWSMTGPWVGAEIASKIPRSKTNSEVGSVLAGMAYLVRSQPEYVGSREVHPGNELQMIVVTHASPSYFRETEVVHSAAGLNEGYTAVDRFRIWGRPLQKIRGNVDTSVLPAGSPLFINNVWDNPLLFGSGDPSLTAGYQETLPVASAGQTVFTLTYPPSDPATVQLYVNGIKLQYGVDYTVGGPPTNQTITYVPSVSNPPILLTDKVEVWYIRL